MTLTLAELATHIPSAIPLFEKYNFDYYQNGGQSFKEACAALGLPHQELDKELNHPQDHEPQENWQPLYELDIERLVDFLHTNYHQHEEQQLNNINHELHRLSLQLGTNSPQHEVLTEVAFLFGQLTLQLLDHCEKEENGLFPNIHKLYGLRKDKSPAARRETQSLLEHPIQMLKNEHLQASRLLSKIKQITGNYATKPDYAAEYKQLMLMLHEFEKNLHQHLHIENNILFPKLLQLEKELNHQTTH